MLDIFKNIFKNKKASKLTAEEREEANEAAKTLLQEQNERKLKLPQYEGLERFELISKIGDGAFSNVFKARDTETGKLVAIKVAQKRELGDKGNAHLHPSLKKKTKATERANILKEVQIMRGVNHPNVVQLIHFSESKDYYYLVLELCEGGELFNQIVKLTYFSEDLARHVIYQVASAVRHLHEECGVVHRDIKPENILFEPIPIIPSKKPVIIFSDEQKEDEGEFTHGKGGGGIGNIKLADFGLSKVIWDTDTLTPCGTVGYTAPEVVSDQKYSKSVDMWAIGCVLYTMLCGFPPFYDESIRELTSKVVKGQYSFLSPWWDPISKSAKDLVSHLLCVDPNERYTIDEFFKHPWMQQYKGKKDVKLPRRKDPRAQAMQNAALAANFNSPSSSTPPTTNHIIEKSPSDKLEKSQDNKEQQKDENNITATIATDETEEDVNEDDNDNEEEEEEKNEIIVPLKTPGLSKNQKRQDLFTPGFGTIKEILDITYAISRLGEEPSQTVDSDATSWTEDESGDNESLSDNHNNSNHSTVSNSNTSTLINNSDERTSSNVTLSLGTSLPRTDGLTDELIAKAEKLALDGKGFANVQHVPNSANIQQNGNKKNHYISTPASHHRKRAFKLNMNQATLLKNRRTEVQA
ncbi:kinase-like domain-containing protein [Cunninghamella echinulata]|nr:kinase-like domain-containing protein [Cunninghamella echinulata]